MLNTRAALLFSSFLFVIFPPQKSGRVVAFCSAAPKCTMTILTECCERRYFVVRGEGEVVVLLECRSVATLTVTKNQDHRIERPG